MTRTPRQRGTRKSAAAQPKKQTAEEQATRESQLPVSDRRRERPVMQVEEPPAEAPKPAPGK